MISTREDKKVIYSSILRTTIKEVVKIDTTPVYMEDITMAKNKHLFLDERLQIQQVLSRQESFKATSRSKVFSERTT